MRTIYRWVVSACITCLLQQASLGYSMQTVRNQRYCEVILSQSKMNLQVLNTWGLNDCPASLWDVLGTSNLKHETGSLFVYLRGPQYYVMDAISHTDFTETTTRTIGALPMREIAWVEIHPIDIIHGTSPYHEHIIHRQLNYTYAANLPVFELIDPHGNVYVMQSYSVQNKNQTLAELSSLNTRLRLPKHWQFKSGVLTSSKKLVGGHRTIVLHDEYLNAYQLAPNDFLD